jgi:Holliday junction resolvase RusA-like endonuclease
MSEKLKSRGIDPTQGSIGDENPFSGIKFKLKDTMSVEVMKKTLEVYRKSNDAFVGLKQIIAGNPPSKSNCYRIVTIRSKDPDKKGFSSLAGTAELKQYKKDFSIQCQLYRNAGIDVDFNFEMDVYYPSRRSDLDNSLKVILDCLQDVKAITNDNLCQQIIVRRHIDKLNPRVEFVITKSIK